MTASNEITIEDLPGLLLVAAPYLRGGGFDHSVIFINHIQKDIVTGFIINKPSRVLIGQTPMRKKLPERLSTIPLFNGGPVGKNRLTFSATTFDKGRLALKCNMDEKEILGYREASNIILRAYQGCTTWKAAQILKELKDRAWYVSNMVPEIWIEPNPDKVWPLAMKRLSPLHHIMSHAPTQPFLN